jgi:hypothetical protein
LPWRPFGSTTGLTNPRLFAADPPTVAIEKENRLSNE